MAVAHRYSELHSRKSYHNRAMNSKGAIRRCDRRTSGFEDRYYLRYCDYTGPEWQKHVCFDCRRTFKMAMNTTVNEYCRGGSMLVRPRRTRIPDVWAQWNKVREDQRREENPVLLNKAIVYENAVIQGQNPLEKEEREDMKRWCPAAWWQSLGCIRCPGCGKEGHKVGTKFEAPPKRDEKAWKDLKETSLLASREDMLRRYRLERWERGRERRRCIMSLREPWHAEERRRRMHELQEALREGRRTDEEIRRLKIIRERRAATCDQR